MRLKLVSLVQADPVLAIYALEHLGENVPTKTANSFYSDMIRRAAQQINEDLLRKMLSNDPARQLTPQQIARLEKLWGKRADDLKELIPIAQTLSGADLETVRKQLRSSNPEVRKLTIQIIARRRLPLEGELIDLLEDPLVGALAHDSLVRVARGIDFGPFPGDERKKSVTQIIKKWRRWEALQQEAVRVLPKKDLAIAGVVKPADADNLKAIDLLLPDSESEERLPVGEMTRLVEGLVNVKSDEQRAILARMREADDTDYAGKLALAIPKLPASLHEEAEDVLTRCLAHMTTTGLRDKLKDGHMELRRTAAFACARKRANELIPDLVQLLNDPENDVIQAARVALIELTGEDFGPAQDADRSSRAEAVAAWRKWCKERLDTSKK